MKEFGTGPPIVLIPGIQGRWEWMWPAVHALAARHRVYTFSLGDVRGPGLFDQWADRIDRVAATSGRLAVVGVSFGGLVAAYYAGLRPERVSRLLLASAPSPRWRLDRRSEAYVRRPRLAMPLFALRGAGRLHHELKTALPSLGQRSRFAAEHLTRVVRYPASPAHMAQCVREWTTTDLVSICRQIEAPTLIITGEASLDRVVPVESSLEYLELVRNASHVTLERTGHLGLVLRPHEFSALVTDFVDGDAADETKPPRHEDGRPAHGARELVRPSRTT